MHFMIANAVFMLYFLIIFLVLVSVPDWSKLLVPSHSVYHCNTAVLASFYCPPGKISGIGRTREDKTADWEDKTAD